MAQDDVLAYNPVTEWTGGGLVPNPQDLVRWATALDEGNTMPEDYLGDLLASVPKDSRQQVLHCPGIRYGVGADVRPTALGTAYGYTGWTPSYVAVFPHYPEHRIAVALQINELGRYDLTAFADSLASPHTARIACCSEQLARDGVRPGARLCAQPPRACNAFDVQGSRATKCC